MNQTISNQSRTLAIALSARGFGFAVMEGQAILERGNKGVKGNKNLHSVSKIEKLMKLFLPDILILQDVNAKGCRRAPRIKALHQQVVGLAQKQKCKVALISGKNDSIIPNKAQWLELSGTIGLSAGALCLKPNT